MLVNASTTILFSYYMNSKKDIKIRIKQDKKWLCTLPIPPNIYKINDNGRKFFRKGRYSLRQILC